MSKELLPTNFEEFAKRNPRKLNEIGLFLKGVVYVAEQGCGCTPCSLYPCSNIVKCTIGCGSVGPNWVFKPHNNE